MSPNIVLTHTYLKKIGKDIEYPWGMDFIDQNNILVTKKTGQIVKINLKTEVFEEIKGLPKIFFKGQGGLLDITVQKNDTKNKTIYFCNTIEKGGKLGTVIQKGVLDFNNNKIYNLSVIFESNHYSKSSRHFGCRLILKNNKLYASLGDRGKRYTAQNLNDDSGSIIEIDLSKLKTSEKSYQIHSIGHRNPQGLTINPFNNQIWSHEHGPRGGDEINIIKKGRNYGWPIITSGEEYFGGKIGEGTYSPDYENPVWTWIPSIAPSGMIFYNSEMFENFKGHILVGSLKFKSLYLVKIMDNLPYSEEIIFQNKIGRIRDVDVGADGSIYLLTDSKKGGLFKFFKRDID
ncbi:MAG: PQQ-dependent sugar dehydrogenase [Paracoccaceae bacterium]